MKSEHWKNRRSRLLLYVFFGLAFLVPSLIILNNTPSIVNLESNFDTLRAIVGIIVLIQGALLATVVIVTVLSAIMIASTYSTRLLYMFARFPDSYFVACLFAFNVVFGTLLLASFPQAGSVLIKVFISSGLLAISFFVPYLIRLLGIMQLENVLSTLKAKGVDTTRASETVRILKILVHLTERAVNENDRDAFCAIVSAASEVASSAIYRGAGSENEISKWIRNLVDNLRNFTLELLRRGQSETVISLLQAYEDLGVALQEVNENWDCLVMELLKDLQYIEEMSLEVDLRNRVSFQKKIWKAIIAVLKAGPVSSAASEIFSSSFVSLNNLLNSGCLNLTSKDELSSVLQTIKDMSEIEGRFFKAKILPNSRWELVLAGLAEQKTNREIMEELRKAIEKSIKGYVKNGQCILAFERLQKIYENSRAFRGFFEGFFDASLLNEFIGNACPVKITEAAIGTMRDFILDNISIDKSFLTDTAVRLSNLESMGIKKTALEIFRDLLSRLDAMSKTCTNDKKIDSNKTREIVEKEIFERLA